MKRVLLLHTGGTLGMAPQHPPDPSRPIPLAPDRYAREIQDEVPDLRRVAEIETRIVCNLDSSDLDHDTWSQLVREIVAGRENFDGVVVIHGTDTMAYTASALSFALVGLDRPVILTGSQRPLREVRTDARRNLVDAVTLATRNVPEVAICFDGQLLRGNRATKGDAWSYRAFVSPACPPLARMGLDVEIAGHVRHPSRPFRVEAAFDNRVAVAHVTPGMDPAVIQCLVQGGRTRGLVLAAFGVGNVPLRPRSLIPGVQAAIAAGVTVLVVTQARVGVVDLDQYESGAALSGVGALSGGEMTLEAAVTKLMHALALHPDDPETRGAYLLANVAGERGGSAVRQKV